jgi:hypothetical protein
MAACVRSGSSRQRGEHQGAVDALLVHQRQPGGGLSKRRDRLHRFSEDLPPALPVRVAHPEVLHLCPGPGDDVERGVGDVVADPATYDNFGAPPYLDVVDGSLVPLREVLRQRVPRLVQVIVGIEQGNAAMIPLPRWFLVLRMNFLHFESIVSEMLPPPPGESRGRLDRGRWKRPSSLRMCFLHVWKDCADDHDGS